MTRKAYVQGYSPIPEDKIEPPTRPFEPVENYVVGYCAEPEWTLPDRPSAEIECGILRRMGVHIGPHYCEFAVESLDNGEFAIVCLTHPEHLKLSESSAARKDN
jgi:hypothetical protein